MTASVAALLLGLSQDIDTVVLHGVEDTKAFERGLSNRTTAPDMAQRLVALERGEVSITGVLHDAAIVYSRDRSPYALAVLTRGIPDEAIARALIADVSRLVYAYVAAGHAATRSH